MGSHGGRTGSRARTRSEPLEEDQQRRLRRVRLGGDELECVDSGKFESCPPLRSVIGVPWSIPAGWMLERLTGEIRRAMIERSRQGPHSAEAGFENEGGTGVSIVEIRQMHGPTSHVGGPAS
jgi:hypothetical protein